MSPASFVTPSTAAQARSNPVISIPTNKIPDIRHQDSWNVNNKPVVTVSTMQTPGERITKARETAGWSQAELARRCGWGQSRIGNYEAGISSPKKEDFEKMGGVLGVEPAWLQFGVRVARERPAKYLMAAEKYSMIYDYAIEVGAGAPRNSSHEEISGTHAYRRDWLERNGLSASLCVVVTAAGQSMYPTIASGDALLINTADKTIRDGEVYAFRHDEGPRIKRLFRQLDGRVRLVSDNPDKIRFPDEWLTPDSDAHIIGRVVHRSGGV